MKDAGLWESVERTSTVRRIMEQFGTTPDRFAEILKMDRKILDSYLDPDCATVDLTLAQPLLDLQRKITGASPEALSTRFHAASRKLFGKHYQEGFRNSGGLGQAAVSRLVSMTDMSEATISHRLPPFQPTLKLTIGVVEAFEQAVALLGGII